MRWAEQDSLGAESAREGGVSLLEGGVGRRVWPAEGNKERSPNTRRLAAPHDAPPDSLIVIVLVAARIGAF